MIATKGKRYYPETVIPMKCYSTEAALYETNRTECYRMIHILGGTGSVTIDDRICPVHANSVLCLSEKECVTSVRIEQFVFRMLCFQPSIINSKFDFSRLNSDDGLATSDLQDRFFLKPFLPLPFGCRQVLYLCTQGGDRLKSLHDAISRLLDEEGPDWPCLTRSFLIELLFFVERTYSMQSEIRKANGTSTKFDLDALLYYLHRNYMNRITLDELAKKFHTNRTTLSKDFREATGETVINYVIRLRTQMAAAMLRETELPMSTILERIGVNNVTHFNRAFRQIMKCLPHEYRKLAYTG